jgi:hypothetical protein
MVSRYLPSSETFSAVEVGISDNSRARLIDAQHRFASFDSQLALAAREETTILAHELADALREEFAEHDRSGRWDDPSEYTRDYEHTIDTIKVEPNGPYSEQVVMAGAAAFVQFGTRPHAIVPVAADRLKWKNEDGTWTTSDGEFHGSKADDFVGRAMDRVKPEKALGELYSMSKVATTFEAIGREGTVYPAARYFGGSFVEHNMSSWE